MIFSCCFGQHNNERFQLRLDTASLQNKQRALFSVKKISDALEMDFDLDFQPQTRVSDLGSQDIILGLASQQWWRRRIPVAIDSLSFKEGKESFILFREKLGAPLYIIASDESGLLYASLEAIEHGWLDQGKSGKLFDHPEMVLRGTAIGLQKTQYLPGHDVYEYPYTEELFPWFYDKELWVEYLDMMLDNRYNTLYLWNGHPFSSLVRLKDYPYAVEVDEPTFAKNEDLYQFLVQEADKRGIWVIQMFYNILLPKPFADRHGLKTQERNRVITPLIEDYTRKSISAFVEKYPNVGLLVTLGEAMEGVGQDDIDWFTNTIIPGVKKGLETSNSKVEPPIILRAHDTDAPAVMEAALPMYKKSVYDGEVQW